MKNTEMGKRQEPQENSDLELIFRQFQVQNDRLSTKVIQLEDIARKFKDYNCDTEQNGTKSPVGILEHFRSEADNETVLNDRLEKVYVFLSGIIG